MLTKFLYITQRGEQPRDLLGLDLDAVLLPGENITHEDRVYKVVERSFVVKTAVVGYMDDEARYGKVMTCALLCIQIAGPPHILSGKPSLIGNAN